PRTMASRMPSAVVDARSTPQSRVTGKARARPCFSSKKRSPSRAGHHRGLQPTEHPAGCGCEQHSLLASRLQYGGGAFRCRPDLVLGDKAKTHSVIIERKTTRLTTPETIERIPPAGWDNVEAQLWCYAFVDS